MNKKHKIYKTVFIICVVIAVIVFFLGIFTSIGNGKTKSPGLATMGYSFIFSSAILVATISLAKANNQISNVFEPEKYRYIPENRIKWNLNQMLYEMVDERVLVILLVLYLFLVVIAECILLASGSTQVKSTFFYVVLFGFPVVSTGIGFGVFALIKKANRETDYVQQLLRNSLPYSDVAPDALRWNLVEDIKSGLVFHTRRVNFSTNYIFISKSEVAFSPIAIPLKNIAEIRYKGHLRGNIYVVNCILKDQREVKMVFSNIWPNQFIAMMKYYNICVVW